MQASGTALYVQLLSDACIIQLPLKKTSKKTVFSRQQANSLAFAAGKIKEIVVLHYLLSIFDILFLRVRGLVG